MATYTYSLSGDFGGSLNPEQLKYEIIDDVAITTTYNGLSFGGDVVNLFFVATLSGPEVTALNNLVAAYVYQAQGTAEEIILTDEQPSGTAGGTFTSGSWTTRVLNTIGPSAAMAFGIVTLSSNQFLLYPGAYSIEVTVPAYDVGVHQARIFNVTGSSVEKVGPSALSSGTSIDPATISHCLMPSVRTVYEIQHQCQITKADTGLGLAAGFGEPETYAKVVITSL
jgi:hypothetical protein